MRFYEFAAEAEPDETESDDAKPTTTQSATVAQQPQPTKSQYTNLSYNLTVNDQVKNIQTKLTNLGYDIGPPGVDGKYGPWTAAAVQAFKQDYKLSGDGNSFSVQDHQVLDKVIAKTIPRVQPSQSKLSIDVNKTGTAIQSGQAGRLIGNNVLAANPDPNMLPKQNIINALDAAAKEAGLVVQITAQGGRASRERTKNHPAGDAADFQIVRGNKLYRYYDDPASFEKMISILTRNARGQANVGIGRYDWGVHYDESGWRQVAGNPPVTTWS